MWLAAISAGCGTPESRGVAPIQLWTHWEGRELEILRNEVADFEKGHPGVRVELTALAFDTFARQIEDALRRGGGGNGPDVFTGINDWIGNFAEKNLILPIDNLPIESPDEFLSYTYEAVKYKDHLYALPISYECIALFYNRNLVKSVPAKFSDWIKSSQSLTHPDRDEWGLVYDLTSPYLNMPWLLAAGEPLLREDGSPMLNSPDKIRWLKSVKAFQDEYLIVPPRSTGRQTRAAELFVSGKAAYYLGGPWDIPKFLESKIDFAVTRLPKMPNGRYAPPLIGVKAIFLTGKGDRPISRDLIRYLGRAAGQRRFAIETARIPSLKSIYEDPVILKNKHLLAFADQASVGVAMPTDPELYAVWRPLQDMAFRPFLDDKYSAEQALSAAQKAAEEEIARYRAELKSW